MKRYVVVNIGCLECGHSTDIVSVWRSAEAAESTGARARTTMDGSSDWHGEEVIVYFEIEVPE